ncbi:MAG: hypothetical protein JNL39_01385 [Opitutaceae bacterium]|nr:hypothetical protein [Opitutaceae bacterium]
MKTLRLLASLATLLAACLTHAADSKPIARVMTILDVETDDPTGYATWLKEYNAIAKAKTGQDNLLRVFQTVFDGKRTGSVRVAVSSGSVAELSKTMALIEADPEIARNVEHLRMIRKMGARALYQAVRFEGASPRGAHNYVTFANVTDEAGYLAALDELRAVFDGAGLKDVKISAYRTLAGRLDHTHRITISAPNGERLAAFMDAAATNPKFIDWLARSAKLRTVVSNTTSREITRY